MHIHGDKRNQFRGERVAVSILKKSSAERELFILFYNQSSGDGRILLHSLGRRPKKHVVYCIVTRSEEQEVRFYTVAHIYDTGSF